MTISFGSQSVSLSFPLSTFAMLCVWVHMDFANLHHIVEIERENDWLIVRYCCYCSGDGHSRRLESDGEWEADM